MNKIKNNRDLKRIFKKKLIELKQLERDKDDLIRIAHELKRINVNMNFITFQLTKIV
jgi:hypothetical protein